MQLFKRQNKQGWVAIRASGDDTTIAHVERRAHQKPKVHLAETVNQNIYQDTALKTLAQQFGLKKARCSLVLGLQDYQLMQVEKPSVPTEEQKQAVRWKLKDLLDYPIEQATVDVLDIPADTQHNARAQYVYAVAAANEVIGSLSNRLLNGGVQLQAIDIQETAQRNIAGLLEQKDRGLALLTMTATGGMLTFTAGGELYHARRIDFDGDHTESAHERIALELQRSLDNFERQFPHVVINKLLIAPFSQRTLFCEHLRQYLYIPVDTFELSDIFDFADTRNVGDLHQQAQLLTVLGAALREEVAA